MSSFPATRRRVVASICILAGITALVVMPSALTEAQRSSTHFAVTEFRTAVQPVLNLEGSTDNASWGESATLDFGPEQMALNVGEDNAVYAQMWVRPGAGTNAASSATVSETGLADTAFANSLRGEIYLSPSACDAAGTGEPRPIASGPLRKQTASPFDLDIPETIGRAGESVELCLKVWMNDNNWLLGGEAPPTDRATWDITATTSS